MKKWFQKMLALALALCCLTGSLAFAEGSSTEMITAPVVTLQEDTISGKFLKDGKLVFVSVDTLKQICPDIDVYFSNTGNSLWLERQLKGDEESFKIDFPIERTHFTVDGMFVPFSTAMEIMGLNPLVIDSQLVVVDASHVNQLGTVIQEIYKEPSYNMRYWKDSENFRRDVFWAEMVDSFRNLTFVSFASGKTSYEGYRDAFTKLLMPQSEEEVQLHTGTDEAMGMVNTVLSIGGDVSEFLLDTVDLDLLGDLKDTYNAVSSTLGAWMFLDGSFDFEDKLEFAQTFLSLRNAEETIVRGLKHLGTETADINRWIDSALKDVMNTYQNNDPLWYQVLKRFRGETFSSVKTAIMQFVPQSYLFDIGNELTNFYLDTGDQLSATMDASRFLDIQTCCQKVFEEVYPNYRESAREGKSRFLQILVDVTNVYLLSGIRAQEAISRVDGMRSMTGRSIGKLREEQQRMARFSKEDIQCYENCAIAADWLRSLEYPLPLPEPEPETPAGSGVRYPTDEPLVIEILWQSSVDGRPMDIAANITGTLDDGSEIYRSPTEGEFTSQSGPVASYSHYEDWIEMVVYRHDAVMDVTVEYGDVMPFGAPSYMDANLDIQFYDSSENIIAVIAANSDASPFTESPYLIDIEPYYTRGATGVWYFTFRLDHGVIRSLLDGYDQDISTEPEWDLPDAEPEWDEPDDLPEWEDLPDDESGWDAPVSLPADRTLVDAQNGGWLDEHYTPDGQLQSCERYNAEGYMLYSRWYDNGECTAYTLWDYDQYNHLTLIRYANAMEPDQVKLLFENTYSGGQLVKVELYNIYGFLLGEGPTAADAADAVGMRMLVEQAMPY